MNFHWLRILLGSPEDSLSEEINKLTKTIYDQQNSITQLNTSITDLQNKLYTLSSVIDPTQPSSLGTISYNEVNNILNNMQSAVYISDNFFQTTTMDIARVYSAKSKVWAEKWTAENHDCDNFSFALNGYWSEGLYSFAFGIAWSDNHAFNFFIDNNKQLWIVEPQTNEYMTLDQAKKHPGTQHYYPWRLAVL
jgi:hypothetical protein